MAIFKSYNTLTPNLGLSDNAKVNRLWGIAGRLDGLFVTEATPIGGGSIVNIRLSPGAFLHQGIVVTIDTPLDIGTFVAPSPTVVQPGGITFTGTFPVNEAVYLVAQTNGPDESVLPSFALLTATQFNAQMDPNNYAAVIGIYNKRVPDNLFEASIPFDGASGAWTLSGGGSTKVDTLNGTTVPAAYLSGANTNSDLWTLASLPSIQALDVRYMALSFFCYSDLATATIATGSVTIGGAVTVGDRLSIFINGFETAYTATGLDTTSTIATALRNALLANPDVSYLLDSVATVAVGPVITLTTIVKGRQAKFDLGTVASPLATTTIVNTLMTGGSQSSFVVDFPLVSGGPTAIAAVTVYPPPGSDFIQVDVPVDLGDMVVATFDQLNLRAVATATGGGFSAVGRVGVTVSYRETNLGIDVAPPSNLAHWHAGASVAVGSGASSSALGVHRLLNPIDHPDRSITRQKVRIGAVGPQEISPRTVGFNFTEGFHTPTQLADPPAGSGIWKITASDLNLEEISDIVKRLALQGFNAGGAFAIDHNASTGHHKSATYLNLTVPDPSGMRVERLPAGDATIDPPAAWPAVPLVPPIIVTTQGQMGILSDDPVRTAIFSDRTAANVPRAVTVPPGPATATMRDMVIASPEQVAAGKIGMAIGMDKGGVAGGPGYPHVTLAYKADDAKPLSGIDKLNGVNARSLQSNVMSLFSRAVCFLRTDASVGFPGVGTWHARSTDGAFNPYADTLSLPGPLDTGAASFIPKPFGAAFYYEGSRTADYLDFESFGANVLMLARSSMLGPFPATRDSGIPAFGNPDIGTGTQWLYLPFPFRDAFRKIRIRATIVGDIVSFAGAGQRDAKFGFLAAPAYDVALTPASLATPSLMPFTKGTDIPHKMTGVIRRFPWVLTPDGYRLPRGSNLAVPPGTTDKDGIYFDSSNFLVPLGEQSAWTPRTSTIDFTLNPSGSSIISRAPLPYYDFNSSGSPLGVYIDLLGMRAVRLNTTIQVGGGGGNINQHAASMELELDLRNSEDAVNGFVTLGGQTPTGIVISTNRFDYGVFARPEPGAPSPGALTNANLEYNLKNPALTPGAFSESNDVDYVRVMFLNIDGIADGNFALVPSKY